jgi:hypothetical protein
MTQERRGSEWRFTNLVAAMSVVLVAGSCGLTLNAQTIRIELLNGKNGRPLAGKCVNVWVGSERKWAMALPTDKDGVASLKLTHNDAQVNTQHAWKGCGPPGVINPVVKYSDPIKINTSYASCEPRTADFSWLAIESYPTDKIIHSGVVTANTCGKARASPEPGEIILFVRPLTFWEKMKE